MNEHFLPDGFHEQLLKQMTENMKSYDRLMDRAAGIDPDNRPTIYVEEPRDTTWLDQRKKFAAQWEAMVELGLKTGFLEHEPCYECGGELKVTDDTTKWVEKPNPDYDADKPSPTIEPMPRFIYGTKTITIPKSDS